MQTEQLYSDSLITITDNEIVFKHYYFPSGKAKIVLLKNITGITVKPSTISNGKWRLHGTGNIKTWYPMDRKRPQRDRIFLADLNNQWINIGFTVENGERVETIFEEKKLLRNR